MFLMPPTLVADRLRLAVAYVDILARVARLVDKPVPDGFSHFVDVADFAQWVATVADLTTAQAASALAALPSSSANLEAPLVEGAR